ncbi:hypothetical protein DFP72DRAFT_1060531 [Ephemerocybe angulata]|uniref:Uncharacterized protein n=1 Tax=Ephemerocybe angulata TaxID=980116 RepID=A0A8H6MBR3_9AGAR|nr:hypothetical protein DFP72DRAFT_1060531 [Tulosesus angulatus]
MAVAQAGFNGGVPTEWLASLTPVDRVSITIEIFQVAQASYEHARNEYNAAARLFYSHGSAEWTTYAAVCGSRVGAVFNIQNDPKAVNFHRLVKSDRQIRKCQIDRRVALYAIRSLLVEVEVDGFSRLATPLWVVLRDNAFNMATLEVLRGLPVETIVTKSINAYTNLLGLCVLYKRHMVAKKALYEQRKDDTRWLIPLIASGIEAGVLDLGHDESDEVGLWKGYDIARKEFQTATAAWEDARDTLFELRLVLECFAKTDFVVKLLEKIDKASNPLYIIG